jgi:integrase
MKMSLRKVGNVWIYRCKVDGKTWARSTGETDKRKAVAKIPELEALAQLHREQPVKLVRLSRAIVAEVARIEVDVSPRQAIRNHNCFKNFLKWLGRDIELSKIDTDLLAWYQRDRLRKAAASTVRQELHAVCAMLRQNKLRVEKPKFTPGRKTEQRDLTEDELARFFQACDEDQKVLFSFLLATGARPAEVIPSVRSAHVALLKKEIDPESGSVAIRSAKIKPHQKPKTRIIHISPELMERVMEHAGRQKGPHVFPVNQSLANLFDRILKRAEIPKLDELGRKLTAHSFRHTYASMMARRVSYNPHILKEVLGHHQLSTTDRYIHARTSVAEVVDVGQFLTPSDETAKRVGVSPGGKNEKTASVEAV